MKYSLRKPLCQPCSPSLMTFWLNELNQRRGSQKSLKCWIIVCSSCSLSSAAMWDSGKQRGLWQTTCSERIVGMSYCTLNSWTRSSMRVPWGERLENGAVLGMGLGVGWSRRGGLVEMVAEVVAVCGISAPQILTDSGQVCTQYINTPRYISRQSLSTCCLQKASMVLKPQSPSGSFQVSSSRTSHTFLDMDLLSASQEGRVPGPL